MNAQPPIPFPAIRPKSVSPTQQAQRGLISSYADMRRAIHDASTVAEAYALWRHLRAIEQDVMALTSDAAKKMEQLEVSELEKGVGL